MDASPIPQAGAAARLWDVRFALGLLTCIPVGAIGVAPPDRAAQAGWAYPLAGAVVGAAAAGVFLAVGGVAGLWLAAALSYVAALALTGALHEDGLADLFDALGVRGDQAAARAAAKQSTIGAYGALALVADAALRIAAMAALAAAAAPALIVAGLVSRAAAAGALAWRASPGDGLACRVGRPPRGVLAAAGALALAGAAAAAAWAPAAAGCLIGLLGSVWAARKGAAVFGGVNGDVAGAVVRFAETSGLITAALLYGAL